MSSRRPYWVFPKCKEATCADAANGKDFWCRTCRVKFQAQIRKKYPWTPEMDAELMKIYRVSKNKVKLSSGLTEFAKRYRFPRYILSNRSVTLGLKTFTYRNWTPEEMERLEKMSDLSLSKLARIFRRSEASIKNKLFALGLDNSPADSYSINELRDLFGVPWAKINKWVGRGWLSMDDRDRIPYGVVQKFIWDHMEEYRFASCEEWWLKQMLKPTMGADQRRAA